MSLPTYKLKHLQELTEYEAEKLAARGRLPKLEPEDELWYAEQWVRSNTTRVACMATGLTPVRLIGEWKKARRFVLERKRFEAWVKEHNVYWDRNRGKFLVHNP